MMTEGNVVFWIKSWNRMRTLGKTKDCVKFSE